MPELVRALIGSGNQRSRAVPGSDQGDPPFGVWSDSFKARPSPFTGKGGVSLLGWRCFTSRVVSANLNLAVAVRSGFSQGPPVKSRMGF